jgi:succinoglycan exporter
VIYTVLILLTERSLLRRLLDMARARKPRAAPAGAAE